MKSRNDKVMGTQDIGQVQELDEAFRQDNRAGLSCVASTTNGTASRMQGVQSKFKMGDGASESHRRNMCYLGLKLACKKLRVYTR